MICRKIRLMCLKWIYVSCRFRITLAIDKCRDSIINTMNNTKNHSP